MSDHKTDWLALGASICHEPSREIADERRREERRENDDLEPGETEFQRGSTPVEDTRREELDHWRRS